MAESETYGRMRKESTSGMPRISPTYSKRVSGVRSSRTLKNAHGLVQCLCLIESSLPTCTHRSVDPLEFMLDIKDELTVVWQSINVEHECHYCVPAHTWISRDMGVSDAISDALRNQTPLPNARLEALRTFTLNVVRNRGNVDDKAVQAFLDAGFTKRQILEVILGVSQKVMSNYTNHLFDTPVDAPFTKFDWQKAA